MCVPHIRLVGGRRGRVGQEPIPGVSRASASTNRRSAGLPVELGDDQVDMARA